MNPCPRVSGCPLFKQMSMKIALSVWRAFYCEDEYARCERWKIASSGKVAPLNLLPNGRTLEVPLDQLEPRHLG